MNIKNGFLLLLPLLFVFCKKEQDSPTYNPPAKTVNVQKVKAKISIDSIKVAKFDKKEYSFKFNTDTSGYKLLSIKVYSKDKLHQLIKTNKEISEKEFSLLDWNFDGYKDITVLYNRGSGGSSYWIWNYNLKTHKFLYNKKLSEVLGLEIDSVSKKAICNYREPGIN